MKCSVIYYSKSGKTAKMAEKICEGMRQIDGIEAKAFAISDVDEEYVKDSKCVIVGTPTYYADVAGELKMFLETMGKYNLGGKIGGAFATANFIHGGGDLAIDTILHHEMVFGMLVYSGGGAAGKPPIHIGPVYTDESCSPIFEEYGKRMATKVKEIFK